MLKLFFIRHTESIGNRAGRMMGRGDDALSDRGRDQARSLGLALHRAGGWPDWIYSSPQRRATETAELARQAIATIDEMGGINGIDRPVPRSIPDIVTDANLCEFDNGILQGLTWPEAQRQYPDLCQALEQSWDWIPIPQAETLEDGRSRAQAFLQGLIDRHQAPEQIWVISHHWMLQQLLAETLGSLRTWQLSIAHGAVFELWLDRSHWQTTDQLATSLGDRRRLNHIFWQIRRFNQVLETMDKVSLDR